MMVRPMTLIGCFAYMVKNPSFVWQDLISLSCRVSPKVYLPDIWAEYTGEKRKNSHYFFCNLWCLPSLFLKNPVEGNYTDFLLDCPAFSEKNTMSPYLTVSLRKTSSCAKLDIWYFFNIASISVFIFFSSSSCRPWSPIVSKFYLSLFSSSNLSN